MSLKIPAIASRVGGNEEIIGADNCFKSGDVHDFLRLIKDNNLNIREKNDFSADKMVGSYYGIYQI